MHHKLHSCIDLTAVTTYTIETILGSAHNVMPLVGAAFFVTCWNVSYFSDPGCSAESKLALQELALS